MQESLEMLRNDERRDSTTPATVDPGSQVSREISRREIFGGVALLGGLMAKLGCSPDAGAALLLDDPTVGTGPTAPFAAGTAQAAMGAAPMAPASAELLTPSMPPPVFEASLRPIVVPFEALPPDETVVELANLAESTPPPAVDVSLPPAAPELTQVVVTDATGQVPIDIAHASDNFVEPPATAPPVRENAPASLDPEERTAPTRALNPDRGLTRLRRLVDRCSFGATESEMALAQQLGYSAYLERQLNPNSISDTNLNQRLATFTTLNLTQQQILQRLQNDDYTPVWEFIAATIVRAVWSRRTLQERMVEFWTDHFNIYLWKDSTPGLKILDDRNVIRPNALGNFRNLLMASARSPAMLEYLDNVDSYVGAPNQNYARELLELHTLSPGNYTQFDIEEIARAFTGWGFVWDDASPTWGNFIFNADAHDFDAKTIFGRTIPAGGGITDGETVINWLARDAQIAPITARFLARKLAVRFWGYQPPVALVNEAAAAYMSSNGEIKAVLRVILSESWIDLATPKLKRPYHLAIGALRAVASNINDYWSVQYFMELMGQHPYYWAPPNGYPDSLGYWGGFVLPRWQFATWLLAGQTSEVGLNLTRYLNPALSSDAVVDEINAGIFLGGLNPIDRGQLRYYLSQHPNDEYRRRETLAMALGMTSYQTY